jgi:hypothetical protein
LKNPLERKEEPMSRRLTVLCLYRIADGKEQEFQKILATHWPTLDRAGLVSSEPPRIFRGTGKDGKTSFIEILQWNDEKAPDVAHRTPEVMAVWEPMGALTTGMEFIDIEPVSL